MHSGGKDSDLNRRNVRILSLVLELSYEQENPSLVYTNNVVRLDYGS
jgi:hypothetical protein